MGPYNQENRERVKENFITNILRLLKRWDLNRWSNRNQNKKFNQFYETFRACIRKDLEKESETEFLVSSYCKVYSTNHKKRYERLTLIKGLAKKGDHFWLLLLHTFESNFSKAHSIMLTRASFTCDGLVKQSVTYIYSSSPPPQRREKSASNTTYNLIGFL